MSSNISLPGLSLSHNVEGNNTQSEPSIGKTFAKTLTNVNYNLLSDASLNTCLGTWRTPQPYTTTRPYYYLCVSTPMSAYAHRIISLYTEYNLLSTQQRQFYRSHVRPYITSYSPNVSSGPFLAQPFSPACFFDIERGVSQSLTLTLLLVSIPKLPT